MKYSSYQVSDFLKDDLFVRWVKNNDLHAKEFWEKWLETHPEKTQTVKQAKDIILSIKYKKPHKLSSDEYVNIYEEIIKESESNHYNTTFLKYSHHMMRIAASILILATISFTIWTTLDSSSEELIVQGEGLTLNKSTLPGQKLTFKLPDGTLVKLNAASTLRYTQPIDSSKREVHLEGEAFFDVAKDVNRPFIVHTNEMSTTALGTSFNVSAYSVENSHKISLLTGRVVVENTSKKGKNESKILLPGDQIIYSRNNNDFQKISFDLELETAWSNGIIMFEDTNFKSVILTLERWYGVHFEIINESKKTEDAFSGIFENQSLERVLEILSFSGGFTFKSSENQVVIEFIDKN